MYELPSHLMPHPSEVQPVTASIRTTNKSGDTVYRAASFTNAPDFEAAERYARLVVPKVTSPVVHNLARAYLALLRDKPSKGAK